MTTAPSALRRDAVTTQLGSIVTLTSGLVTGILVARVLGPEARGELAAVQVVAMALASIAPLGLTDALTYYCARQPLEARSYWATASALTLPVTLFLMVGGYIAMPTLLKAQSPETIQWARAYLLLVVPASNVGLSLHALRGIGAFTLWNSLRIIPSLLWVAVVVLGLLVGVRDAIILAAALLIARLMINIPEGLIAVSRLRGSFRFQGRESVRSLLGYGLPNVMATIPALGVLKIDQVLVAAFLPAAQLGYYAVGVSWAAVMAPLLGAIGLVAFPRLSAAGGLREQREMFLITARVTTVLAFVLTVLWVGLAPVVIPLVFGGEFRAAVLPAMVLAGGGGMLAFGKVTRELARGIGKPRYTLEAEVGGTAVLVVVAALLVPKLGIIGASLAWGVSHTTATLWLTERCRRYLNVSWTRILIPTAADIRKVRQIASGSKE